jgi:CO/xanthine dehydrogenase FAD-binding subunit
VIAATRLSVLRPKRLKDALAMLRDEGPLVPLAGGTDLYVSLNAGQRVALDAAQPGVTRFIDLWPLAELRGVKESGRRELTLGALTTYSDCLRSKKVHRLLPILADCAREVGGVQIQNRGTLGGNLGNGSPAGDTLPVLAAADALVQLRSRGDEREVPLTEFYTGYRASVRRPDELIVGVRVKVPRGRQVFRKVGPRAAQAISKVVMAAVGERIAFGALGPTVLRARRVEEYLAGGGRAADEARRLLALDVRPIDDVRSTAAYRLCVAQNLVGALIAGR